MNVETLEEGMVLDMQKCIFHLAYRFGSEPAAITDVA